MAFSGVPLSLWILSITSMSSISDKIIKNQSLLCILTQHLADTNSMDEVFNSMLLGQPDLFNAIMHRLIKMRKEQEKMHTMSEIFIPMITRQLYDDHVEFYNLFPGNITKNELWKLIQFVKNLSSKQYGNAWFADAIFDLYDDNKFHLNGNLSEWQGFRVSMSPNYSVQLDIALSQALSSTYYIDWSQIPSFITKLIVHGIYYGPFESVMDLSAFDASCKLNHLSLDFNNDIRFLLGDYSLPSTLKAMELRTTSNKFGDYGKLWKIGSHIQRLVIRQYAVMDLTDFDGFDNMKSLQSFAGNIGHFNAICMKQKLLKTWRNKTNSSRTLRLSYYTYWGINWHDEIIEFTAANITVTNSTFSKNDDRSIDIISNASDESSDTMMDEQKAKRTLCKRLINLGIVLLCLAVIITLSFTLTMVK